MHDQRRQGVCKGIRAEDLKDERLNRKLTLRVTVKA